MFNTHNCRPPTYLNIDLITCKVLGFLNLHRIYRNLHKFTPLFEKFTKIYVIYSVNCIWHPAPHPLFPGLSPCLACQCANGCGWSVPTPEGEAAAVGTSTRELLVGTKSVPVGAWAIGSVRDHRSLASLAAALGATSALDAHGHGGGGGRGGTV